MDTITFPLRYISKLTLKGNYFDTYHILSYNLTPWIPTNYDNLSDKKLRGYLPHLWKQGKFLDNYHILSYKVTKQVLSWDPVLQGNFLNTNRNLPYLSFRITSLTPSQQKGWLDGLWIGWSVLSSEHLIFHRNVHLFFYYILRIIVLSLIWFTLECVWKALGLKLLRAGSVCCQGIHW